MIILNHVKEIRESLHLTTRELAKLCEVSNSTITNLENGLSIPSHITMLLVCKGLNRKFHEVFETDWKCLDVYFGRNTDHY